MGRPIGLLIKPAAGLCNLRCKYCFYHDLADSWQSERRGVMTRETARALIDRVFETSPEAATFAFQGGEPTMAGLDFFRDFVTYAESRNEKNVPLAWAIQTNGILIDDEWARFLAEKRFLTGLSLDGDRRTHDMNRVFPDGSGSFSRVLDAAKTLTRNHAEFNILTVLTATAARHPQAIYEFMKKNGFGYLQFIPCLDPLGGDPADKKFAPRERESVAVSNTEQRSFAPSPDAFAEFYIRLFAMWKRDLEQNRYVSIRYFDNLARIAAGFAPEQCGMYGFCPGQWVIESDGGVYPCDFYVIDELRVGNVVESSFAEMERSENRVRFVEESKRVEDECRACRHYALCCGGCRRDRQPDPAREIGRNRLCEGYKKLFDAITPGLADVARLLK